MSSSWVGPLLVLLTLTVVPTVAAEDPAEPPPCEGEGCEPAPSGCGEEPCPAGNSTLPPECRICVPDRLPALPPLRPVRAEASLSGFSVSAANLHVGSRVNVPVSPEVLSPEARSCSWASLDTSNPRVTVNNPYLGILLVNARCATLIVKVP